MQLAPLLNQARQYSFYVQDPSKQTGSNLNLQSLFLTMNNMPAEYFLTIGQKIEKAGFSFEEHSVITSDGYILGMFRVMNDQVKAG